MPVPFSEARDSLGSLFVQAGDQISARKFNALVRYVASQQQPGKRGGWQDGAGDYFMETRHKRGLWVRCSSTVTAPPYSIVEVSGGQLLDDSLTLNVQQATPGARIYAGNESYDLVSGSQGWVRLMSPHDSVKVTAYGSPPWLSGLQATGLMVQAGNAQGHLLCMGTPDSAGRVAVIAAVGNPILVGQTTATHTKGTTQTVNVYRGYGLSKGLETFTPGDTVQAYNRFSTIASGKWVGVADLADDGWELICAEC